MNGYAEQSLLSGKRGAVFGAVVLLHFVLGFALYFELGAQIRKAMDPMPIDLVPIDRTPEPVKPWPRVPMISQLHFPPVPELPHLPPPADTDVIAEIAPPVPPDATQTTAPQPIARSAARMDPKHPLRIGAAYYPDLSRLADEMGRCVVQATVAADGRITAARIQSSTGFNRLDLACVNAVRGQRMLPALEDGNPIESVIAIPIVWNLSEK
jgi:protein TonB